MPTEDNPLPSYYDPIESPYQKRKRLLQKASSAGKKTPTSEPTTPSSTPPASTSSLSETLRKKVIGQVSALESIAPYVELFTAGLHPTDRPVGVFLLLGPTGVGKTHSVEALAECLHGNRKNVLRVDCGEYQMEHEVAKLIGSPPGYLGHRETIPVLSQQKIAAVVSEHCKMSIVLFDEIEKAAPSMTRLMLGLLDKGTVKLGDGTTANFENSLIFMTSNLAAKEFNREIGAFGLTPPQTFSTGQKNSVAYEVCKKRFAPEFRNRIDQTLVYGRLTPEDLRQILHLELTALQGHLVGRLGSKAFLLVFTEEAKDFLLAEGTSAEFGARELKRVIHRRVTQRLAALLNEGRIGSNFVVTVWKDGEGLGFSGERAVGE